MSDQHSEQQVVTRAVVASFIGTTIEWYDFFLYLTASSLVFGELFFPNSTPLASLLSSYATNAVGFFARPLGGVIFGHYGDRIGRKKALVTTLVMMGAATFCIGLLPTYKEIGIAAPIALTFLRVIQGIGVGGEWGGAVLMAVEHGHAGRRGFLASWVQAGVPVGLLIATLIFGLCSDSLDQASFLAWGWRIPFLIGGLLMLVGLFIRFQVLESPVFAQASQQVTSMRIPLVEVLVRYPRNVLLAMGARFAENVFFYIITAFVITYGKYVGFQKSQVLQAVLIGSAAQLVAIPFFGYLSDHVGRRPVYLGGAFFVLIFAFPFFWMVDLHSQLAINLAVIIGLIAHSAMYGPQAAFFSELFGTSVRYSGASIGYQLASPFAGGLAPLIATYLLFENPANSWRVATYVCITAIITIVSVWFARETNKQSLDHV